MSVMPAGQNSSGRSSCKSALKSLGVSVLALLLTVLVYLFYFGGYRHLLVDESASFAVELTMRILDANRDARLLVVGNSTVAEGFRASTFNKASAPRTSLNLGVGSAHFFVFEKLATLALQRGIKPDAILLVLTPDALARRPGYDEVLNDMTLMKTELSIRDYSILWSHSHDFLSYSDRAGRMALRPSLFTTDLNDLLFNPLARFKKMRITYGWMKTAGNDPEALETFNQFAVCDAGPLRELQQSIARERSVASSELLTHLERVWEGYSVRVHQPLAVDAHQERRLKQLLSHFTSLVPHVYVAFAPYYDPDLDAYPAEYRAAFVQEVRETASSVTGVSVLPEFASDCTMFFDTVHLNHAGGEKFTTFLHERMALAN